MDKILIGIPTLNGPQRLASCLEAIRKTHDFYKYNITLVVLDDCSSTQNLEENKKICAAHGINLLMHEKRLGVAAAWNNLMNFCESEYCILLNDDVIVCHNWIDVVIYTLKNNQDIGVVGLNAYEGENSLLPPNNIPTYIESQILLGSNSMPLLSVRGYAFGFRQADFKTLGGFDTRFFCFFEEIDFNLSMMAVLKKRNCILSYPILKHSHGATTFSELPNHSDIFLQSQAKFEEKWRIKWADIRQLFNKDVVPAINKESLNEWNSNINIWG